MLSGSSAPSSLSLSLTSTSSLSTGLSALSYYNYALLFIQSVFFSSLIIDTHAFVSYKDSLSSASTLYSSPSSPLLPNFYFVCLHCLLRAAVIGYQHDSRSINNKTEGMRRARKEEEGAEINTRFVRRRFSGLAKVAANSDQRQSGVYYQRVGVAVNRLLCREMDLSKLDGTIFSPPPTPPLHLSAGSCRQHAGRASAASGTVAVAVGRS